LADSQVESALILQKYKLETPFFVYTGNAYPHKNLERAISAIVRLNQHSRAYFAIVCTRNVFTKRLEKTIDRLGAKHYIRLTGFVPDEELSVIYKNALGFLFPSLSEGFGLPGLEAIAAGTLPVISNIEAFKEVYANHALYFNPYRIDDMADALMKVVKMKKNKREDFIKSAGEFITRYSWEKMAVETLKVYKSVD